MLPQLMRVGALLVAAAVQAGCASPQDAYVRQSELRGFIAAQQLHAREIRELKAEIAGVRENIASLASLPQWRDRAQTALEALLTYQRSLDARVRELDAVLSLQQSQVQVLRRDFGRIELQQLSTGEIVVVARPGAMP